MAQTFFVQDNANATDVTPPIGATLVVSGTSLVKTVTNSLSGTVVVTSNGTTIFGVDTTANRVYVNMTGVELLPFASGAFQVSGGIAWGYGNCFFTQGATPPPIGQLGGIGSTSKGSTKDMAWISSKTGGDGEASAIGMNGDTIFFISPSDAGIIRCADEDAPDTAIGKYDSGTAWVSLSDENFKQDVIELPLGAVELVKKLKPSSYKYKHRAKSKNPKKAAKLNYGLVAQEVAKVIPDAVSYEGSVAWLDMDVVHAHHLKATAELAAEVEVLKAEIAALKSK